MQRSASCRRRFLYTLRRRFNSNARRVRSTAAPTPQHSSAVIHQQQSVFVPPPSSPIPIRIPKAYLSTTLGFIHSNRDCCHLDACLFRSIPRRTSCAIHPSTSLSSRYLFRRHRTRHLFPPRPANVRDIFLADVRALVGHRFLDRRYGNFHAHDPIGTPAIAYGGNLTFLQLVFGLSHRAHSSLFCFYCRLFRGGFFTAYALIEKRLARVCARSPHPLSSSHAAIAEGVRVAAIALVVSVVLGTSERLAVFIVIALTIVYTFEGGMKAVIWTEVAQLLLISRAAPLRFLFSFTASPRLNEVAQVAAVSATSFRLFDFSFSLATKYTFWSGSRRRVSHDASHARTQHRAGPARRKKRARTSPAALIATAHRAFPIHSFLLVGVLPLRFFAATSAFARGTAR